MNGSASYFKIGLFVLAGAALLAAGLIFLGSGRIFKPRIYVETYLDGSVQGVDVGSPVKFRGVPIGRVSDIDFTFNQYPPEPGTTGRRDYVILVLEIDRQTFRGMFDAPDLDEVFAREVEQGLRVMLQPQGITGLNYAELDYVALADQPPPLDIWWTPWRPYIPSAPGTLTSMLDSINTIMDTFKSLDVKDTISQMNSAMQAANSALQSFNGSVGEMQLGQVSKDLRGLLTDLRAKLDQVPVGQLTGDAENMMKSLTAAAENAQTLVDKLQTNPLLNRDAVGNIVGDFQATAENFRVLSENLREYPSQLLLGQPPKRSPFDPAGRTKPRP
ncbi:MAG: MlaD family protein [Chthoniobacterales bacterium]|jgi:ABC-type transporter Mla subunit MlaD